MYQWWQKRQTQQNGYRRVLVQKRRTRQRRYRKNRNSRLYVVCGGEKKDRCSFAEAGEGGENEGAEV